MDCFDQGLVGGLQIGLTFAVCVAVFWNVVIGPELRRRKGDK
jgi:hypothetical protein